MFVRRKPVETAEMKQITKVLLLAMLVGACGEPPGQGGAQRRMETGWRGIVLDEPIDKRDFTLLDTEGREFRFRESTDGFVTLLFFGYTYCPDVCPVHYANLAAVLPRMPYDVRSRLKVVFVTTDPERDTPERIRSWLNHFDPSFIGLWGELVEVNRIQTSLHLPPAVIQKRPDAPADAPYDVGHSSQMLAFATDGRAYVTYPFGTRQEDWAHDLPRLVRQGVSLAAAAVAEPAPAAPAALYLTLRNRSDRADALVAIHTEAAARTELHRQIGHEGMSHMQPVGALDIPAQGELRLEPGSDHAMLLGLRRPLRAGDTITVELQLRRGGTRPVRVPVVGYADLERALTPRADEEEQE
jgi:cytochrome oxidase Cu insertion factor (SCO1/SenC/PrrC family)/copper(I)-binding protein